MHLGIVTLVGQSPYKEVIGQHKTETALLFVSFILVGFLSYYFSFGVLERKRKHGKLVWVGRWEGSGSSWGKGKS